MIIARTIKKARTTARDLKSGGQSLALVPTMGYLHEGHLSLIRTAKKKADKVAVSIFVNPLQFGENEDFAAYPRDEQRDIRLLRSEKVDLLFVPQAAEIVRPGQLTEVSVPSMDNVLCGRFRPGHFTGVATIVAKLFNIIEPDHAVFGLKDRQQFQLLKRMVNDLDLPVRMHGAPIVRDSDGLALSSRNKHLSKSGRQTALLIPRSLDLAEQLVRDGERDTSAIARRLKQLFRSSTAQPRPQLQYLEFVDPETLEKNSSIDECGTLLALAAFVENVRLIDNRILAIPA